MRRKQEKRGVQMGVEKIRRVLRLRELGRSQSEISLEVGISRAAVQDYTRRAQAVGLTADEATGLSEEEIRKRLNKSGGHRQAIPLKLDIAALLVELSRKGVTLELLYKELVSDGKMPCSYSTFCRRIKEHEKLTNVTLKRHYAPGEYWFVDYAGLTVPIWNTTRTEVVFQAQIFVGVLGASGKIFCEATQSQEIAHFIGSHVRGFEFYGGVPILIVPDNLKSGVVNSNYYEPELTRAYQELGEHYNVTALPARVRKPRDKAKVERGVLAVERWVLAPLRKEKFTSLAALNTAIQELTTALNNEQMREFGVSRSELFERLERAALKPLPETRYEVATIKQAKVNIDYHIQFDQHYYSVPYQYVRQEVWIRATEFNVEIILDKSRLALHPRCRKPNGYTTLPEHMPSNHLAVHSRKADMFLDWARAIGPETAQLVERVFTLVRHEEQGYRTILGFQRLAKTYTAVAFEAAAKEANGAGVSSCKRVKGIIARQYAENLTKLEHTDTPPVLHSNLRDPKNYQ